MAENKINVLIGYDDEVITEKYNSFVNFTTNKIGGRADLPSNVKLEPPKCPLCLLPRLLVVQIYAPIETTTYHRTLYVFACINPNCWNQSESWICLRAQTLEQVVAPPSDDVTVDLDTPRSTLRSSKVTDWCADADDWDEDCNANINEENGNVIGTVDKASDEDEESCSLEESVLRAGMEFLTVTDERNANSGEAQGGAAGRLHSPCASAEIEAGEGDVISIDSPTRPHTDIPGLLHQTTPLPNDMHHNLHFLPYFVYVTEERTNNSQIIADRHVRDLLQAYQQNCMDDGGGDSAGGGASGGGGGDITMEKYEESVPAHGDKMFHYFLTKVQENPGQILRYSRGSTTPLLLYPLQRADLPRVCAHCADSLVFEFQLLPTLIQRLRLANRAVGNDCVAGAAAAASAGACADEQRERLEWGNVLIYTCRKSCWGSTEADTRAECVVVQKELY